MSRETEDLAELQRELRELRDEYKRGEITFGELNAGREVLEERIIKAGGTPEPTLEERLQAINVRTRKKTEHISQMYAAEWLRESEQLGWLADQFDAAEGTTVERLDAALIALRARVGETPE